MLKKKVKSVGEVLIETLLKFSGIVSSLVVVLIVFFLFREGFGLFSSAPVEEGYVVAVHPSNPVEHLEAEEIKDIYDEKITFWSDLGGKQDTILPLTVADIASMYTEEEVGSDFEHLPLLVNKTIKANPAILVAFSETYLSETFEGKLVRVDNISPGDFFGGKNWYPTATPAAEFGALPLILGTLWVSLGAILIALPLGLAASIYMAEIASDKVRNILKPIIELLAGIPSVVYGFFGLVVVVPYIKDIFGLAVGETALTGSIILAVMALPTIITISEDSIRTTPRAMKEASLALGASHWQTIVRVIVPYSASGITAAAILGIGRAIGETMAVLMVTGNAAVMPSSFLEPVRTIPATIAAELGEAPQGGIHYESLFALGCILFLMTLTINLIVEFVSAKKKGR